ncbi:hypothetical protein K458DRAFT_407154 [Lentithecium fluviatile CBS 122367]|uniref:Zn(2)-C6 fungal-type domain-containing protein n=1 Tax=Lentithecium fluviatile CBS 122367 TaxID=1168545 RepID=A0A6G1IQZ8_9PLEO|nr:hypothetical protein K458DRAFT_407154 [Lentithecium fluviatile CBS 122367]
MSIQDLSCIVGADEAANLMSWLADIQIAESESKPSRGVPTVPQEPRKSSPRTPIRNNPQLPIKCAEISRTDTIFSYNSVFSSPDSPPDSPISETSPTQSPLHCKAKAKGKYAETNKSSIFDDEEAPDRALRNLKVALRQGRKVQYDTRLKIQQLPSPPSSILSSSPIDNTPLNAFCPARGLRDVPIALAARTDTDADTDLTPIPPLTWITSCLQCTLAGLQCSRTPPTCSRCKRNGHGEMCLLQRRRRRHEMEVGNSTLNRTPVLLKLKGCDEEVVRRKEGLKKEMIQTWLDQECRKNWVLPINDGKLGAWKTAQLCSPKVHPGESLGRITFARLQLLEEKEGPTL